jgi:hypothetical protein
LATLSPISPTLAVTAVTAASEHGGIGGRAQLIGWGIFSGVQSKRRCGCLVFPDGTVFLLNVFAKGGKVDLSPAERNELPKTLHSLAAAYRKGAGRYAKGRRKNS